MIWCEALWGYTFWISNVYYCISYSAVIHIWRGTCLIESSGNLTDCVSCLGSRQRASPGCFSVELNTCWPSSLLSGTASLWPARWWELTCCLCTPERSYTLSISASGGSVHCWILAYLRWLFYYIIYKTVICYCLKLGGSILPYYIYIIQLYNII